MPDDELYALDAAIERHPEAPVNYLLRGEAYARAGELEQATLDLETARDLAQQALGQSDWGYIYQSYIDRAGVLLEQLMENLN